MFLAEKLNNGAGTPVAQDPQFNYVTMLLHGDGTNGAQNNTFLDSSSNNFTITRNGNTTQGSFSPYGENWSNYFNGSSYFETTSSQIIPAGSFTVECLVYVAGTNSQAFVAQGTSGNSARFSIAIDGGLWWAQIGNNTINAGTPTANTWNYLAATFNGSTLTLYVNGSSVGSVSTTTSAQNTTLAIGNYGTNWVTSSYYTTGYISNVRISNVVRTITTPTAKYTSDANTNALFCQSNRFIDASANAYAISIATGTPSVQRFNPFGASTAYSTSVIGGSGYFDGSGDYLDTPSSSQLTFGTNNFTIEFWIATTNTDFNIMNPVSATGSGYWGLLFQSGNLRWNDAYNTTNLFAISASAILDGAWHHVAICRSSGSTKVFYDGVLQTTQSDSTNYSGVTSWRIGYGNVAYFKGYLSDFRVSNNAAFYTSAFTPPTAPLTAVSGTSLLLNYINGAIFDNAMMNDLETVGNAQISTSVKKYGTGSIYLDGTTNTALKRSNTPLFQMGTGNFTVEFWAYFIDQGTSNYYAVTSMGTNSLNIQNQFGTFNVQHEGIASIINFSLSPYYGAWNHFAVVRYNNNTTTVFVNGTSVASSSDTSNYLGSSDLVIGNRSGGGYLNAYIDDLRITKGYARYTANFTPPTAAFPNTGPV
jgi:hypothetical protein